MCTVCQTSEKFIHTPTEQSMKLKIMTISSAKKVLIKFGASEMVCVELSYIKKKISTVWHLT